MRLVNRDDSEPLMKNTQAVYSGLTYSKGGISNETQTDNMKTEDSGFSPNPVYYNLRLLLL